MEKFYCSDCKTHKPRQKEGGTGYAVKRNGHKVCYACCALADVKRMDRDGKTVLYLTMENGKNKVTNWPSTLKFENLYVSKGRHNWGLNRYDVWFTDHRGSQWHGRTIGDNTQICHCKRTKEHI